MDDDLRRPRPLRRRALTPACSPPSGSTFTVGTTTVTCTATDSCGNTGQCSFTVRVNDSQPPSITCPANISTLENPFGSGGTSVNYTTPAATDDCTATVVCAPPSGSFFPAGTMTVTCTATDPSNNTAICQFTVTVVSFDICVQDDSNSGTVLLWNSTTGDYLFCCGNGSRSGRGVVTRRGSIFTLQHNTTDRRVSATVDRGISRGNAVLQAPPGTTLCSITDRDTRNNSCACSSR